MEKNFRDSILQEYRMHETSHLLEFWNSANPEEWHNVVFEVVQEILIERNVAFPKPSKKRQIHSILNNVTCILETGDLEKAKKEINRAIKIDSEQAQSYIIRAEIYERMGEFELAIKDYQAAIGLNSALKIAWKNMHRVEKYLNEKFEQSEEKQHLVRALEYFYDSENEKAIRECEIAKPNLPPIALAHNFFGLIMAEMGLFEKALDSFIVTVKMNDRFIAGWRNYRYASERVEEEKYISLETPYIASSQYRIDNITDASLENQPRNTAEIELLPQWVYLNLHAYILTGWPGHRNRRGRSGNDPIDIYTEESYLDGLIFRKLIGLKFRTINPIYLFFMTLMGLLLCFPLFLIIPSAMETLSAIIFLLPTSPYWFVGLLLLINVGLSLKYMIKAENDSFQGPFF
jgi:tetratricopeptide (TPR) repeat protein